MDNIVLDKLLSELATHAGKSISSATLLETCGLSGSSEWDSPELKYLETEGYAKFGRDELWHPRQNHQEGYHTYKPNIIITPLGLRFIKNGGFTGESTYKDETLQVAKDSKKYAKWAFWISVLGIIITILLFLIDKL